MSHKEQGTIHTRTLPLEIEVNINTDRKTDLHDIPSIKRFKRWHQFRYLKGKCVTFSLEPGFRGSSSEDWTLTHTVGWVQGQKNSYRLKLTCKQNSKKNEKLLNLVPGVSQNNNHLNKSYLRIVCTQISGFHFTVFHWLTLFCCELQFNITV